MRLDRAWLARYHLRQSPQDCTARATRGKFTNSPGTGTAYLAQIIGDKKAREVWYLCRRYNAQEALQMGLCNAVVPHDALDLEVNKWCNEILEKSPTAIAIAKASFNASTDSIRGIGSLGFQALSMYYNTEESREGVAAFKEKRKPEFRKRRP